MSDLPPGLDDFGDRLEQAAERDIEQHRRRRWRASPRTLGLPVAAALLAAAASAGAVRLADSGEGDPIKPEPSESAASLRAAEDPSVVVKSAADDPRGGPPWVLRVYTSGSGQECVQVGQLRDGRFGLQQRGQFRVLPASSPGGTCVAPDEDGPLIAVRRGSDLTVVHGLAVDSEPVTVRVDDETQRVQPAALGAFVAVFAGGGPRRRVEVRSRVRGRDTLRRME